MPPHKSTGGSEALSCSYEGCKSPHESRKFIHVDGGGRAGGQDWSELAGSVLCHTCYDQFRKRGRLERTQNEPLSGSARRCTYEGCKRPQESKQFYQIDGGSKAGGQDWTQLAGSVLCTACYLQYMTRGTLERTQNKHLAASARRCGYEGCKRPGDSSRFYQIDGGSEAGGQDWSTLGGKVLCDMCYQQFRTKGTLVRTIERAERAFNPASRASSRKRKAGQHEDDEQRQQHDGERQQETSGDGTAGPKEKEEEEEGRPLQEPRANRYRRGGGIGFAGRGQRAGPGRATTRRADQGFVESRRGSVDFDSLSVLCNVASVVQKEQEGTQ
jgi:hypothetical protein